MAQPGNGGRARGFLGQLVLVLTGAFVYFGVRGLTEGSVAVARSHGHDVLAFEQRLGIAIERSAQNLIEDSDLWMSVFNWVYIWAHWPVIIGALIWLHHARPAEYVLLRNAMFVSGIIGMFIFALYPVAPPRLLGQGFIDTVTERSQSYRVLQPPSLVNKYAALPSLHVGWNLLVGIMLFRATGRRLVRAFAVIGPVAMVLAVVFTANHYVVDAIAGAAVALVGLVAARSVQPHRTDSEPATEDESGRSRIDA